LAVRFSSASTAPAAGLILDEPELHFGNDVLVPDLAGWRSERVGDWSDAAFITLAPDWVCEVPSPSTERIDRTKKLAIYAREAVQHVWLLDPPARALAILRLGRGRWSLAATHEGEQPIRAQPFDAIALELELGALWA